MSPTASEAPGRPPTAAPSTVSRVTAKAKEYIKFWAAHVKKGEVPWTQWYCCGLVNGKKTWGGVIDGGLLVVLDASRERPAHASPASDGAGDLGVLVVRDSLHDRLRPLRRIPGLEDAAAHEDTVTAQLHHQRGVRRRSARGVGSAVSSLLCVSHAEGHQPGILQSARCGPWP
ncbi:unnamed protein product [Diplocarpon coronariae]